MSHNVKVASRCLIEAREKIAHAAQCVGELELQLEEIAELRKTCAALADENEGLKIDLRRWYKPDGSSSICKSREQVVKDRKAAAAHLDLLLVENFELKLDLEERTQELESLRRNVQILKELSHSNPAALLAALKEMKA